MKTCQCEPFQSCELCKVDLSKPGAKIKKTKKVSRTLRRVLEPPEDRSCINCKQETDTENYHHAESKRIKMLFGGGIMAGKGPDRASAWLCNKEGCGVRFDNPPDKDGSRSEIDNHDLFSYDCIILTWNGN